MPQPTVNDVIAWFEADEDMADVSFCHDYPEIVWQGIFKVLERDLDEEQKENLVVGPLEELLYLHGEQFIDRVEDAAKSNPQFNHMLGGVWRAEMPLEIWNRVQQARTEVW
jgi:hypothetical protein